MNKNLLGALVAFGMAIFFGLECLHRLDAKNAQRIISLGVRGRDGIPTTFEVLFSGALATVCFGVAVYAAYLWQKEKS
jgi:hypothetical protein